MLGEISSGQVVCVTEPQGGSEPLVRFLLLDQAPRKRFHVFYIGTEVIMCVPLAISKMFPCVLHLYGSDNVCSLRDKQNVLMCFTSVRKCNKLL